MAAPTSISPPRTLPNSRRPSGSGLVGDIISLLVLILVGTCVLALTR